MMVYKTLLQKDDLKGSLKLRFARSPLAEQVQIAIDSYGLYTESCTDQEMDLFLNFETQKQKNKNTEILFKFFPQLALADIYQLLTTELFDQEDLLRKFQIPNNEKTFTLIKESALLWNEKINLWFLDKKIRPQEISFLLSLTADQRIELLNVISQSVLSKSQALQLLEWTCDLLLLKVSLPKDCLLMINESTLERVKELRFPKNFTQHPLQSKKLNWGTGIQGQFLRKQDRAGFQVQFFVSTPEELQKVIHQLQKNQNDWNQS